MRHLKRKNEFLLTSKLVYKHEYTNINKQKFKN